MSVEMGMGNHEPHFTSYPRRFFSEEHPQVPSVVSTPQSPRMETRIVGKAYGRDIRAEIEIYPDGTTVFDHQPPDVELYNTMYQKIEPGTHMLPGYEYSATILPSETGIFHILEDPIGNKQALAEVYLLGDHYRNGVGERIPGDLTWSRRVKEFDSDGYPIYEEETRAFVSLNSWVYEPGQVRGHVLQGNAMTGEYLEASKIYDRVTKDEVHMQKMKKIREEVEEYRREKINKLLEEPLLAVGD